MPKELEDEVELFPDQYQTPIDYAEIVWPYMKAILFQDVLYTWKEAYYALPKHEITMTLHDHGIQKAFHPIDRTNCVSFQVILDNLWRRKQPKVRKFFNGEYHFKSHNPMSVRWMFLEGRVQIASDG